MKNVETVKKIIRKSVHSKTAKVAPECVWTCRCADDESAEFQRKTIFCYSFGKGTIPSIAVYWAGHETGQQLWQTIASYSIEDYSTLKKDGWPIRCMQADSNL
jgi:hypothetical protein